MSPLHSFQKIKRNRFPVDQFRFSNVSTLFCISLYVFLKNIDSWYLTFEQNFVLGTGCLLLFLPNIQEQGWSCCSWTDEGRDWRRIRWDAFLASGGCYIWVCLQIVFFILVSYYLHFHKKFLHFKQMKRDRGYKKVEEGL